MHSSLLDFSGQQHIVMGGSSGIGRGIAQAFHHHKAKVIVTGTRPSLTDYQDCEELDGCEYHQVNVEDPTQLAAWVEQLPEKIHGVVCCQGMVKYHSQEFESSTFDQVLEVNLNSVMHSLSLLKSRLAFQGGGTAIALSSVMAYRGSRGNPAYSASKWGLRGLTQTLADAWAKEGIRINGIAPGFVPTRMTEDQVNDPTRLKRTLASIPAGRLGTPADMAGAALFLASGLSSYIYGQTLVVDGGFLLR